MCPVYVHRPHQVSADNFYNIRHDKPSSLISTAWHRMVFLKEVFLEMLHLKNYPAWK